MGSSGEAIGSARKSKVKETELIIPQEEKHDQVDQTDDQHGDEGADHACASHHVGG